MVRTPFTARKSLGSFLVGFALVVGLAFPALATPPEDVPFWAEILNRLDTLQDTVDNLPESAGPCDVPPVWGKKYVGADRFESVLDGEAYCDKETGLVWEAAPDISSGQNNDGKIIWRAAVGFCLAKEVGNRKGWHLPLLEQLASLVDVNSAACGNGGPCLPDGHPFQNVQPNNYWTASTNPGTPVLANRVDFSNGGTGGSSNKTTFEYNYWCVRGGQAFDGNTHDTLH